MKPDLTNLTVNVDATGVDEAIEKCEKLRALLSECKEIIGELSETEQWLKANIVSG